MGTFHKLKKKTEYVCMGEGKEILNFDSRKK